MQTVYQTQTAKANVCFVVVPKLANQFQIYQSEERGCLVAITLSEVEEEWIDLPESDWQLIGPLSEISEEQAAQIVDRDPWLRFWYKMYHIPEQLSYDIISTTSSQKSLQSLARSLNIPEGQNIVVLAEFKS